MSKTFFKLAVLSEHLKIALRRRQHQNKSLIRLTNVDVLSFSLCFDYSLSLSFSLSLFRSLSLQYTLSGTAAVIFCCCCVKKHLR